MRRHGLSRAHAAPLLLLLLTLPAAHAARAQDKAADRPAQPSVPSAKPSPAGAASSKPAPALTADSTAQELARAAYESLGGDRFRDLKNMVLSGTIDLYAPNSVQSVQGRFGVITAGEKIRQEMQSPFFNVSLVYDGQRSYSSLRGFEMPPPSKFGLPVLLKSAQPGYTVAALADKSSKKTRAFRVTDAEGNATDFYVELASARLVRYDIPFGDVTFIVELKSSKSVDGVTVPTNFVQKLATPQGSFIAEFKVKDARLNQQLPADAFAIPNQ